MAKLLYNVSAYENTATKWATDTKIYPANSLLIESDTGILKKGDGVKTYANLATIGAKQAFAWADVTGKPSTFAPEIGTTATKAAAGNHNHAVVADAESGLEAASDIQALAIALSTRIKALEDLAST